MTQPQFPLHVSFKKKKTQCTPAVKPTTNDSRK